MARVMSTQRPAVMMILTGSRRLVSVTLGEDRVIEGSSLCVFAVGQFSRYLHHRRVIYACSSCHARPAPSPVVGDLPKPAWRPEACFGAHAYALAHSWYASTAEDSPASRPDGALGRGWYSTCSKRQDPIDRQRAPGRGVAQARAIPHHEQMGR